MVVNSFQGDKIKITRTKVNSLVKQLGGNSIISQSWDLGCLPRGVGPPRHCFGGEGGVRSDQIWVKDLNSEPFGECLGDSSDLKNQTDFS